MLEAQGSLCLNHCVKTVWWAECLCPPCPSPPNSYREAPTPHMTVLEMGPLVGDYVYTRQYRWDARAFTKGQTRELAQSPSTMRGCNEKVLSTSQEESSPEPSRAGPRISDSHSSQL